MTYYRAERSTTERYPRLSGGGSETQQTPTARSRPPSTTGSVVHQCRVGQAIHGGPASTVHAGDRVISSRMRYVSESAMDTGDGSMAFLVNPSFINACREGDDNRLRQLMTSRTLTPEMINLRDKTGKTGVNLVCANGNLSLLQLISSIPTLDINLGDNEGNTPLHFVSQAGHVEVLHFLLNHFKNHLQIDARNNLGFTALMKASLQGRTKCVKLLLAAGASSVLRDYGRGFCAYEWARFCSRQPCAEVIEKFMKSCNHSPSTLRKQLKDLEKWSSEPNLQFFNATPDSPKDSWLKQKLKRALFNKQTNTDASRRPSSSDNNYSVVANLTNAALCASSPLVPTASSVKNVNSTVTNNNNQAAFVNGDSQRSVPVPKVQVTEFNLNSVAANYSSSSSSNRSFSYN